MRHRISLLVCCTLSVVTLSRSAILGEWNDTGRDDYQPNAGRRCTPEDEIQSPEGVKWFVDNYREKVYPFFHLGCDLDDNVYDNVPQAELALPKDTAQCIGFNMTGWPLYSTAATEGLCPQGSSLLPYGEYSAICCNEETEARYNLSLLAGCPFGEVLSHDVIYLDEDGDEESRETRTLRGKQCSHEFCPTTHFCIQSEFEAYCCPAPSTVQPQADVTDNTSYDDDDDEEDEEGEDDTSGAWIVDNAKYVSLLVVAGLIGVFAVLMFVCLLCRTRRNRAPLVQKFGDREGAALNP